MEKIYSFNTDDETKEFVDLIQSKSIPVTHRIEGTRLRVTGSQGSIALCDSVYNVEFQALKSKSILDKTLKIFRYVRSPGAKHFHEVDWDIELINKKLIEKVKMVKGEVTETQYFADSQCTDLVVDEKITYTRDQLGFALYRTTVRTWYCEGNVAHPETKTTLKYYYINPQDMIEEGVVRRGNLIKSLQIPVLSALKEALPQITDIERVLIGRAFLNGMQEQFSNFISHSDKTCVQAVRDATDSWLDVQCVTLGGVTIRNYILEQLRI